nr:MAG TPA: hypothetical protein [Inoviridae sp.]
MTINTAAANSVRSDPGLVDRNAGQALHCG